MGTGIVFVVLVAIWVVYFVQYWSRRREHLATARSVEAFAEAMRVLERRPVLRAPAGPRVSSAYAMSPARVVRARPASRPQVIAKPHPTTPSPSRGGAHRMSTPTSSRPSPQRTRPSGPRSGSTPARMSPSRKVRGLALLGSLVATVVIVGLAAFSVLLWWVPLVGVAAVGASFFWLRSGVQGEIAARRATPGRRPVRRTPVLRGGARPLSAAVVAGRSSGAGENREPLTPPAGANEREPVETTSVSPVAEDPDAWRPVPVPPPTYTLKAKAERPAAPAPEVAAPAPVVPGAQTSTEGEPEAGRTAAYGT